MAIELHRLLLRIFMSELQTIGPPALLESEGSLILHSASSHPNMLGDGNGGDAHQDNDGVFKDFLRVHGDDL